MAPLRNPRHEKYVQALFSGQPQNAAYEAAGYSFHERNASRLRRNEQVVARLTELQAAAAKSSQVTVASLISELEEARQQATSLKQLSAVVRAVKFEGCKSPQDIVRRSFIEYQREGYNLEEKDWEEFRRLNLGWWEALDNFLAAAKAKPVQPAMNVNDLERHERKRLGPAPRPHGNGSRQ